VETVANDSVEQANDVDPEKNAVEPEPPDNVEPTKHSSTHPKKKPECFAGNMKTIWKAGKDFETFAAVIAAMLGVLSLPNVIMAEPKSGQVDLGIEPATLFPDATLLPPIDPSIKTEQLRAYHARLDVINDAFSGDSENADWKPEFIEKYVRQARGDGSKEIFLRYNGWAERNHG
jgi:hypothetical protein